MDENGKALGWKIKAKYLVLTNAIVLFDYILTSCWQPELPKYINGKSTYYQE